MAVVVRNQKETDGVTHCFPNRSSLYLQENNLSIFPCCWHYYSKKLLFEGHLCFVQQQQITPVFTHSNILWVLAEPTRLHLSLTPHKQQHSVGNTPPIIFKWLQTVWWNQHNCGNEIGLIFLMLHFQVCFWPQAECCTLTREAATLTYSCTLSLSPPFPGTHKILQNSNFKFSWESLN